MKRPSERINLFKSEQKRDLARAEVRSRQQSPCRMSPNIVEQVLGAKNSALVPCGLGTLNRESGRFAFRRIASTSKPIRRRRSNKASGMGTRSATALRELSLRGVKQPPVSHVAG